MVRIINKETQQILDANGEFEIFTGKFTISYDGRTNALKIAGNVNIELDAQNAEIDLRNVNVNFTNLNLGGQSFGIDGNDVKMAAQSVQIGTLAPRALLNEDLVTWINTHTHTAPGGATGVPIVPAVATAYSTKILKAE